MIPIFSNFLIRYSFLLKDKETLRKGKVMCIERDICSIEYGYLKPTLFWVKVLCFSHCRRLQKRNKIKCKQNKNITFKQILGNEMTIHFLQSSTIWVFSINELNLVKFIPRDCHYSFENYLLIILFKYSIWYIVHLVQHPVLASKCLTYSIAYLKLFL